jgi:hypothetical protein
MVDLYLYRPEENSDQDKFFGWTQYQIGETGDLVIESQIEDVRFIAIGDGSGQVDYSSSIPWQGVGDIYCPGSLPPADILPGGYAEVLVDELLLKDGRKLNKGDVVKILDGASCEDNTFVWWVESVCAEPWCENFYVPESGPDGYYLRPLDGGFVPLQ